MVGASVAAELILTGRFIDAARAVSLGLASRVDAMPQLLDEARALANDMLATSPLGLRLTKDGLNHAIDGASLEAVIALEDRQQILCTQTPEFVEAVNAFVEKRTPNYVQKI
jgi:enoyl-CoA hydratase